VTDDRKEYAMTHERPRSLLVATDLTEACDPVVRAAGRLAAHAGAELHVLYALEGGGLPGSERAAKERREEAREALDRQLARALPPGVEPAGRSLLPGAAHQAIELRAEELAPDLVVLGPRGGTGAGAHFLGSTADRVLRTSKVPCLVVRGDLQLPLRRVGVPVDFSAPSRGALHLAYRWAPGLTAGRAEDDPPVRLVHVGWPVTQVDVPDFEEATLRPRLAGEMEAAAAATGSELSAEADVLWDNLVGQRICHWAEARGIDLLFVGTHGRSGLPRALLGSEATRLAREAPCSVLLVPPSAAPEAREAAVPALDRVLLATDFSPAASEAGAWVAEHLAPDAELVLAHVVDVPYPPRFLRRDLPPHEELVATALRGVERRLEEVGRALPRVPREYLAREGRGAEVLAELARESRVDLIAAGGHGRSEGLWESLGSTAESLLARSPVPVLVARGVKGGPPRHLLVPLDDSADARHALDWAVLLAARLDARLTLLHVVGSGLLGSIRWVSSESASRELEGRVRAGVAEWLEGVAAEIGLPGDRVAALVEEGRPALEILASAARLECDLIVMGSRGSGGARIPGLGTVASAVVRHGAVPVLVVPSPRGRGPERGSGHAA
jgi:nucleotide-binding universal stress UspA family protein